MKVLALVAVALTLTASAVAATLASPTNFRVTGTAQTTISVAWSGVTGATGYSLRVDGGPAVVVGGSVRSYTYTGLSCGSSHKLEIRSRRNSNGTLTVSPWVALTASTKACSTTGGFPQGIWTQGSNSGNTDAELTRIKNLGYDFVLANPDLTLLDRIQAHGLRAMIWLGNYRDDNDSSPICVWNTSDSTLTSQIQLVRSHPATMFYMIADEPHVGKCVNSPQQVRDRNSLIKSLDPNHPTVISENRYADYDELANTTDILAIVGYPCSYPNGCRSTPITERVAAAEAAGVRHYWAMPQILGEDNPADTDPYYRMVTPTELSWLYGVWAQTRQEGAFTFLFDGCTLCSGLSTHPELDATVKSENFAR